MGGQAFGLGWKEEEEEEMGGGAAGGGMRAVNNGLFFLFRLSLVGYWSRMLGGGSTGCMARRYMWYGWIRGRGEGEESSRRLDLPGKQSWSHCSGFHYSGIDEVTPSLFQSSHNLLEWL